jgi:large subunit ribosomal protein L15
MKVHEVNRGIQRFKKGRRVGRGIGSGRGKTAGRGHKGQRSNPGYAALPIFQGGTMPLVRRIPKRGFHNAFALTVAAVNVSDLEQRFEAGEEVTPEKLRAKSLLKRRFDELKILGNGELHKKLKVCAHRFSETAKQKIEQAGGEVVVLPGRVPCEVKQKQNRQAGKDAAAKKA